MTLILRVALICRRCGRPFEAIPKSPGVTERLCFWCWLPGVRG